MYVRNTERIRAEESLLWMRIVAEPHIDRSKHDDGFIDKLRRLAQIEAKVQTKNILTSQNAADWGMKVITQEGR